ncbi:MAG TPA: glutaredoxin family protein [Myxococcota bacterium]|nr:glutaredoxin family protein [Myxococcota bacterium]
MTVRKLAWLALVWPLLACSAPSSDDAGVSAEPASQPAPSPKRTREPAAPRRAKETLRAGNGYYQYVDESGKVRFAESLEDVPERQRSTAGHISLSAPHTPRRAEPATDSVAEVASTKNASIVLYTTATCPYCKAAKAYLQSTGHDYVDKNIEDDQAAYDEMMSLTGGKPGVPVIMVGDQWIQGWSQPRVAQMLAAAR